MTALQMVLTMYLRCVGFHTITYSYTHTQLVLAKTQEKAASSLTEVTWLGRKLPVRNERLRVSLVKLQQLEREVGVGNEGTGEKVEVYERLLMECQDAMQIVRDELTAEMVSQLLIAIQ